MASLGISTYGIRAVAKVREDKEELTKVFQELTLINIFMSVIVSILLLFVSFGVEQLRSEMGLLLITCITILVSPLLLIGFTVVLRNILILQSVLYYKICITDINILIGA